MKINKHTVIVMLYGNSPPSEYNIDLEGNYRLKHKNSFFKGIFGKGQNFLVKIENTVDQDINFFQ